MSERKYVGGKDRINSTNHYADLKKRLMEDKNFKEEDFYDLENNQTSFNMNYYGITANEIIDDLEAKLFNENLSENSASKSKMIELIKISFDEKISKKQKAEKTNKPNNNNIIENKNKLITSNAKTNINSNTASKALTQEDEIMNIINSQNIDDNLDNAHNNILFKTENQNNNKINFKIISTFDEDKNGFSQNRNDSEIKLNFFEEKITEEYPLVPINENVFLEEYKIYFEKVKESFKDNYFSLIGQQSDTFDIDKFILLVLFENTEGKPAFKDIGFFDPLNNFKKYVLREEDFNSLKEFYFFNGQIVMIEGEVDNYNTITLKDLRNGFVPDLYNLDYQYIMNFYRNASPYCIYAMSGPYCSKEDLDLTNFVKTLKKIAEDKPHLVIFCGPFVNLDNSVIKKEKQIKLTENDDTSLTHHQVFEIILSKINEAFHELVTNVIICPSLLDTTNIYPIPQPAFNTKYIKNYNNLEIVKKKRMKMICNPNTFHINEMIAGIANFDFSKELINSSYKSPNKIPTDSTLEMILNQRSYFPLLPIFNNSNDDKNVIIEYSKLNNIRINETPDVIFTTSDLRASFKKINNTVFINLGSFYKGKSLGNIVKMMSFSPRVQTKHCDILKRLKIDIIALEYEN